MKKIFLAIVITLIGHCSYAQFQSPANGVTWTADKVGIGTSTPNGAFEVLRGGTNSYLDYPCLRVTSSGSGSIYGPIVYLNAGSGTGGRSWGMVSSGVLDAAATGGAGNFAIYDATVGAGARLVITPTGYTGIGTLNPQYRLNLAQDITMNQDIDIAQFGISGGSDPAKRIIMGYDVNGAGFGL